MIKSWLAPKPVDRPVLAGIVLDPLFKEFITLQPYTRSSNRMKYDGFLVRENTFSGIRKTIFGQHETGINIRLD